jgi:hypothetical protein
MPHLFLKIERFTRNKRCIAWTSVSHGARSEGQRVYNMSYSEAGEFAYLLERNKRDCVGAGGQYEYRMYVLAEAAVYPYAIAYPDLPAVREKYPEACRIINMKTGEESSLADTLAHAKETVTLAMMGKLVGSFDIPRATI